MRVRWINGLWCKTARCFWQISISVRHIKQQTKSFFFCPRLILCPFHLLYISLAHFLFPLWAMMHLLSASFLYWRLLPILPHPSPHYSFLSIPWSLSLSPLTLSLSSFTGVARSDGGLDHCGNLWEKVVRSLAQLRREGGSERLRKTLGWLCVFMWKGESERKREKKGGELLVLSRMLFGGSSEL